MKRIGWTRILLAATLVLGVALFFVAREANSWKPVKWIQWSEKMTGALAISPDGKMLFVGGGEMWGIEKPKLLWSFDTAAPVYGYRFSENGKFLIHINDSVCDELAQRRCIDWFDSNTKQRKLEVRLEPSEMPDDDKLFRWQGESVWEATHFSGWQVEMGVPIPTKKPPANYWRGYNALTGKSLGEGKFAGISGNLRDFMVDPQGKTLFLSMNHEGKTSYGSLEWIDVATKKPTRSLSFNGEFADQIQVSPDGKVLVLSFLNGAVNANTSRGLAGFDAHTGKILWRGPPIDIWYTFLPLGKLLACHEAGKNSLDILESTTGNKIRTLPLPNDVSDSADIVFSPDEAFFYVCDRKGVVWKTRAR